MMTVSSSSISVLLADDHEMMRESLAHQIDGREGLHVVGQAPTGVEAVRLCEELHPDVLVLDFGIGDMTGTTVVNRLKALSSPTRILILTQHENLQYAERTLHAGAAGYLIKSGGLQELVDAIHQVHQGGRYISQGLNDALADTIGSRRGKSGVELLSDREFELLGHVGDGLTIQEASHRMHVSESTASTYRSRLMKKLNLRNTAEMIRFAIEHDISSSGRPHVSPTDGETPDQGDRSEPEGEHGSTAGDL